MTEKKPRGFTLQHRPTAAEREIIEQAHRRIEKIIERFDQRQTFNFLNCIWSAMKSGDLSQLRPALSECHATIADLPYLFQFLKTKYDQWSPAERIKSPGFTLFKKLVRTVSMERRKAWLKDNYRPDDVPFDENRDAPTISSLEPVGLSMAETIDDSDDQMQEFVKLKAAGYTLAEISARPGWDTRTVQRIKKRLQRRGKKIF